MQSSNQSQSIVVVLRGE
ncbi:hypothetical protein YPPY09_0154, partial [Yersinia pestis PY-09]